MKVSVLMAAALAAGTVCGAAKPVVDTDFVFPAAYVEDFAIDGNVEKDVWKKASVLPPQMLEGGKEELPYKDEIRLLYSHSALYVAATLWQDLSKGTFKWDQRDMPGWMDENLELFLFLRKEDGKNGLYQILLNPLGAVTDLLDGNIAWSNGGIEAKAVRYGDRWTVECKLPFAGFPMDRPVADDFVGARFCRWVNDGARSFQSSSPFLIDSGNNQRGRFAKLLFAAPTGPGAEKVIEGDRAYALELRRKRFYGKFDAFLRRFDEVKGGSDYFRRSKHPQHVKALGEVRKMAKTLEDFEARWSDELKDRRAIDAEAAERFFAVADAFDRYAADNAYMVWIADPWSVGSDADLPPTDFGPMPEKIAFEQAGNEREQVCLEISGLLCGSRLDLRFHAEGIGTKGFCFAPKGQYLSSDSFEIYVEPFVQIEGEVVTMPLVRAHGNIVTVTPGRTVRVWVVFNSRGVPADTYRTTLRFKALNDLQVATRDVPMEAKVWNFALPETHDWPLKSFFWGPFSLYNDEVAVLETVWENHITHGWTEQHRYKYGMCRENHIWPGPCQGKGKKDPARDFEDEHALHGNQKFLDRAKELDMRFVIGWGTPVSLDWFKTVTKRFLDMGFAYEDFTFHGLLRDEFVRKDIPEYAKYREAVWNWNTNLQFMATLISTPPPTGPSLQDIADAKLPQFFSKWMVIESFTRDPDRGRAAVKMIRDAGKEVWSYNCSRFMHKQNIRRYYRFYPWRGWMSGLDGIAMWTFGGGQNDGWDAKDGFDDGITWRGLDRSAVPTKQLFAFREGLEDVAYMDLLEKALKAEKSKGRDHLEYGNLLADCDAIIKSDDQSEVDAWRLAVGRAIDALTR